MNTTHRAWKKQVHALANDADALLPWAILAIFIIAFLSLLRSSGNLVGGDFLMFCDKLLIGNWHLHENGFRALRYTPYFCGGTPIYNDPEDIFFSLFQLLSYVIDFRRAFDLSLTFHLVTGYLGWYLVGMDVMRIGKRWSHLLALVVVSNGFYFVHVVTGHVTFHYFPLLGALTWLLLDRRTDSGFALPLRAACMALLSTWILYGGGYIVMLYWVVLMCLAVPLELLVHGITSERSETIFYRCAICGSLVVLACLSKLVAVRSMMEHIPRTIGYWTISQLGLSEIVDSLWRWPEPGNGYFQQNHGPQERQFFLSPATLIGLLLLASSWVADIVFRHGRTQRRFAHPFLLGIFLVCYVACLWALTAGRGVLFENIHDTIPLFQSLRVGARFLYLVGLCASVGGVWGLARFLHRHAPRVEPYASLFLSVVTIASFLIAFEPFMKGNFGVHRDYNDCRNAQLEFDGGKSLHPVTTAKDGWQNFATGATGRDCPNALYQGRNPHKGALTNGRVDVITDGTYNLLNPACDAYPLENNCKPGDAIAAWDKENFELFRTGQTPPWNIGWRQRLADKLSIIAIACSFCFVVVHRKEARKLFFARHAETRA